MKKKGKTQEISQTYWLTRFFVAFGIQLGYILLILLVERLVGALWAFLPLLLMPLFECIFGGVYALFAYRRTNEKKLVFYTALGALALAGLLYEIAALAFYGWQWDAGILLFDGSVILALLLGLLFGVRGENLRRKIHQRRTRFDD